MELGNKGEGSRSKREKVFGNENCVNPAQMG